MSLPSSNRKKKIDLNRLDNEGTESTNSPAALPQTGLTDYDICEMIFGEHYCLNLGASGTPLQERRHQHVGSIATGHQLEQRR